MMRRGATGGIYVWFSHAPTIVRVDPRDLSTTVIDIANPFYAAPEHVHYTELSSREEWLRWRAQHYTVSHVAETEDHLVVQYRSYNLESQEWYFRVVIIDRETRAGVATLRLNSPLLRLFGAVGEHELLLVQFEEDATVLSTVNIPRLVADLAD
jgi:hypothetical protein